MSEPRDPNAGNTITIPPGGSHAETVTVDSATPSSEGGAPTHAPTVDLNPGDRGPAIAPTDVAPAPTANPTVDMSSPSMGATLDAPSPARSTAADGGFTTDAGFAASGVFVDGQTTDEGSDAPVPARGRRSNLPRRLCRATRSSTRSAEAAWASSTRPGTSGWIAWSRSK